MTFDPDGKLDYDLLYLAAYGRFEVEFFGHVNNFPKAIHMKDVKGNTYRYTLGSGYHDTPDVGSREERDSKCDG